MRGGGRGTDVEIAAAAVGTVTIVELAERAGICASRSEARRAIKQGGMSVNNVKVTDENAALTADQLLAGGIAVLRRGRQKLAAVRVA